ncbi:MAG: hypothetical protein IJP74_06770 [Prevotella sp.]|nr:hypothetical protein [Prevotella sp.]
MKRRGFISPRIETKENFEAAFEGFADGKHKRAAVRKFEAELDANLDRLLKAYASGTWISSEYTDDIIHEHKTRTISKVPVDDHVIQWAACMHVEPLLCGTYIRRSCSCVKGRGTHDFMKLLSNDLGSNYLGTYYFVQLDAHHYFQHISHQLMKDRIRTKIKDPKLLAFLDEFIGSYYQGLPLGVKLSQILANFFLSKFDHEVTHIFNIAKDSEKMAYWRSRYVTDCFLTCRTEAQAAELAKGVEYLNRKFDRYVAEGLNDRYQRFADNMVTEHEDKCFLHLVTEIQIMILARDYYIEVNKNWNVRPVYDGGIDVCGYVFFHDTLQLRKRNKQALCREVAKCKKKGLSPEETRLKCASRIGFASHADTNNLLRKLDINMEKRLGTVIKNRKVNIPFKGMRYDQKRTFSEIVCKDGQDETPYKILLVDFIEDDSTIEKETVLVQVPDGNGGTKTEQQTRPKKRLAIRYKRIVKTTISTNDEGEEVENYEFEPEIDKKTGRPTGRDAEWYSYSGSSVLLDQASKDFTKEDLPCPTVITEFTNKQGKKFLKFT